MYDVTVNQEEFKNYLSNQADIEDLTQRLQEGNTEVEGESDREYAHVSTTFSWAFGANFQGWITYGDGTKIYFKLVRYTRKQGFFAGGGALPALRVLKPALLDGKQGCVKITRNFLYMEVDGKPVLSPPLPVIGTGHRDSWLEGIVEFSIAR